jgi:hypothetical protein
LSEPRPGPAAPDDIENAFRGADHGGGCSRIGFDQGGRYLLILERGPRGAWFPVPEGGSRAKEDYEGQSAPWARTVRRYLALQSLRPAARPAALAAMRDGGRDRDGAPLLPRADIAHHLRLPSQWKPTAWLLERYRRAAGGEAVDIVLAGPAQYHRLPGRMAAFPGLTADERARLLQAVLETSARGLAGADDARTLGDANSPWLLSRLLRGEPPDGTPLSCPG